MGEAGKVNFLQTTPFVLGTKFISMSRGPQGNDLAAHARLGSEGFERERHVRWSIDLRYGPAAQPFDWHGDREWAEEWPPFIARSDEPGKVTPWEEWEMMWRTPRHRAAPRL